MLFKLIEQPIGALPLGKDGYTGTGVRDRSPDAQPFCQPVDIRTESNTLDLTGDSYFQGGEELTADIAYWFLSPGSKSSGSSSVNS